MFAWGGEYFQDPTVLIFVIQHSFYAVIVRVMFVFERKRYGSVKFILALPTVPNIVIRSIMLFINYPEYSSFSYYYKETYNWKCITNNLCLSMTFFTTTFGRKIPRRRGNVCSIWRLCWHTAQTVTGSKDNSSITTIHLLDMTIHIWKKTELRTI